MNLAEFKFSDTGSKLPVNKMNDVDVKHIGFNVEDIMNLTFTMNTPYTALNLLKRYMTTVCTRYTKLMVSTDNVKNREDTQKIVDEMSSISLSTILYFGKNINGDLDTEYVFYCAICYFLKQVLSLIYNDSSIEISLTPTALYTDIDELAMAIVVEPILDDEHKVSYKKAKEIYMFFVNLITYLDADEADFMVFTCGIMANTWIKDSKLAADTDMIMMKDSRIDMLFPNNVITVDQFYNFRAMILKKTYNINIEMIEPDNNSEENEEEVDSETKKEQKIMEVAEELVKEKNKNRNIWSDYIDALYSAISNIPIETIKKDNKIPDNIVCTKMSGLIETNSSKDKDFPISPNLVDYTSTSIYKKHKLDKIDEALMKIGNGEKSADEVFKTMFGIGSNEIKINIDENKEYKLKKDSRGYCEYLTDFNDKKTNSAILNFNSYLSDILPICVKKNILNKNNIEKIIDSYKKDNIKFISCSSIKDNFKVKIKQNNNDILLTISKKSAIIDNIKIKLEGEKLNKKE